MPVSIAPVRSTVAEASHLIKASAGSVYGAYALNLTATNGFMLLLDATSVPADGAVTPKAAVPLFANSFASIQGSETSPLTFVNGIVLAITSAVTPFTLTTSGGLTGFLSCQAQ